MNCVATEKRGMGEKATEWLTQDWRWLVTLGALTAANIWFASARSAAIDYNSLILTKHDVAIHETAVALQDVSIKLAEVSAIVREIKRTP